MIKFLKRLFCHHIYDLSCWHLVHLNGKEPLSIIAEEMCIKCGKTRIYHDNLSNIKTYMTRIKRDEK